MRIATLLVSAMTDSAAACHLPHLSCSEALAQAIDATAKASNVVVFTGAGMSADSGIGTFRGQGGSWSGLVGKISLVVGGTPVGWNWIPGIVWNRFVKDFYGPIAEAKPHDGHSALQDLDSSGLFDSFSYITMNVDGLHQTSGATNDQVAEVHGSVLRFRCMACDKKLSSDYVFGQTDSSTVASSQQGTISCTDQSLRRLNPNKQPRCDACGGRVRPDVTLFTESLPQDEWEKAMHMLAGLGPGDVMIVAGTSSVVYPAASIPEEAARRKVTVIEFNLDSPTPLSKISAITVQGKAVETLPQFVRGVLEKKKAIQK